MSDETREVLERILAHLAQLTRILQQLEARIPRSHAEEYGGPPPRARKEQA